VRYRPTLHPDWRGSPYNDGLPKQLIAGRLQQACSFPDGLVAHQLDAGQPRDDYMLSRFGKLIFVATSLAPLLIAYAIDGCVRMIANPSAESLPPASALPPSAGTSIQPPFGWWYVAAMSGAGVALSLVCCRLIRAIRAGGQAMPIKTAEIKSADKEALTFLVIYLMPIISKDFIGINSNPLTAVYVIAVIAWAVYHCDAFCFNPVLALFGYHFYEVKNDEGIPYLLLTRQTLLQSKREYQVVRVSDYVFLDKS
jgi:hypothetical protein